MRVPEPSRTASRRPARRRAAPLLVGVVGASVLAACGGGTETVTRTVTSTQAQAPTTTTAVPTTPTVATAPTTATTPTTVTSTTPTTPTTTTSSAVARRKAQLERSAESTVRNFYASIRARRVSAVCSLLSTAAVNQQGGRSSCRQGRYVTETAVSQVPPNNKGLKLTTILTNNNSRATILVTRPGRRYAVRLARQGGQWRVAGTRKFGG